MRTPRYYYFILLGCLVSFTAVAQSNWPREIALASGGKIVIYQPQPENLNGNKLSARAAVSVRRKAGDEPVFGAVFVDATLDTDKDSRTATLESVTVRNAKFADAKEGEIEQLKTLLETEIPKWELELSLDQLLTALENTRSTTTDEYRNEPPTIIYTDKPSTLVLLDGDPVVKPDKELKMDRVMNTPYLIIKDGATYYLYGGKYWYNSPEILTGWQPLTKLPSKIKQLDEQLKKQEKEQQANAKTTENDAPSTPKGPTAIVVRTKPTELIQSDGEAQYASVEGTSLLYMSNTSNEVFKDINSQKTYVLLSGRWYAAPSLNGPWQYVAPDKLPADFAKIPEGSEKDVILANVAGTHAAEEAVLDAQIPQTAKVDRKTATATVSYDGEPQFESIPQTDLERAVNTASTVMRSGSNRKYYCVENGVWFESANANGPWTVCTERPGQVDRIPPSDPAYNTRYVYIYDTTPQYVYMGYTPGYMGCYVAGPTVVYGTGYFYRPWYGAVYYPRPVTWGYGMCYNPWTGFSMTVGFGGGFFFYSSRSYYGGGWFGPPVYRPPYRPYYGGYYGARPIYRGRPVNVNQINININHTNNIYTRQRGVVTRDVNRRPGGSLGSVNRPLANRPQNRPSPANPGLSGRPGISRPDISRPSTNRPDVSRPSANRPDVSRPSVSRPDISRPSVNRPEVGNRDVPNRVGGAVRERVPGKATGIPNDVFTDRSGNVFRREQGGGLQQREQGNWRPTGGDNRDLNRAVQTRDRALQRQNSFDQHRQSNDFQRPSRSVGGNRPAPNQSGGGLRRGR
ncbi:hypothetical protein [Spirosoma montaniterrae]|uniref:Carbohydrate-binding family V/XII n=1 Tax=Spirosoma montaniterrae TaxID=1178516 RepID=A0A1P9X2X8_9BACT|nr:hypothetical protein [Spirosoma montaniterrae]AQG81990.1 hypothetical protein AWR27_23440 [Spirosoma montaniterrae]